MVFSPYVTRIAMMLEELEEGPLRAVYMVVSELHDQGKRNPHDKDITPKGQRQERF